MFVIQTKFPRIHKNYKTDFFHFSCNFPYLLVTQFDSFCRKSQKQFEIFSYLSNVLSELFDVPTWPLGLKRRRSKLLKNNIE